MSSRRSRSFVLCLAVAAAASAGCGGGGHAAKDTPKSAPANSAPRPSAPPPTFDADHIRTSLLPSADVAKGAKIQTPTFPGLTEQAVPTCSASTVRLPGRPKTLARQLRTLAKPGFTGTAYIQLIAIYPDAAAATAALNAVRAKVKACPAKRHFPAKKRGARKIAISHTDTWAVSEDTVTGWSHLRGSEIRTEPPTSGRYNIYYDIYDYATRGNVLAASFYWERVTNGTPGRPTADRATAVLTKQLKKFG